MPVDDRTLLDDLRRVAAETGKGTVGQKHYREAGQFDDSTITRRFGSWNDALRAAGLALANEVSISDERLFENLLVVWTALGRQPRRADLAQPPSTISQTPYARRFGSWTRALESFVNYASETEVASSATAAAATSPPRQTGRDPSLRLRFRVLQRDAFRCVTCGASPAISPGVVLHVDHITAWSNGGETTLENLRTTCSRCNLGKGAM
jgi:5-methylcytosine-specific restriction endonuclease McrA